jgi:hypothetical protein
MGKIKNLHTLELEMEKMKLRAKHIEQKLDDNVSDLRENIGTMAFNSILGQEKKQKLHHFWSRMAEKLMDNPRLQNNIGKWVDKIADKLADKIEPTEEEDKSSEQ